MEASELVAIDTIAHSSGRGRSHPPAQTHRSKCRTPTTPQSQMQTITILSPSESSELLNWCKSQTLIQEIFTGRPTCRLKKWWGYEAEFYFNKSHIEKREAITNDKYLDSLRQKFKPKADSILLYKYETGGEIGEHLDKKCFDKWVTLINLTDSADLFNMHEGSKFRWNRKNYYLQHGEVVTFDSRVLHSVPKVKSTRYSLQFRNITSF